jgi:hypothetical protein
LFGSTNLPRDAYLNNNILDPLYKSATVSSIIHFDGIQGALATLAPVEQDLQLAIVIDALRWSQVLRCGPVCYPNGDIVYFIRVKSVQPKLIEPLITPMIATPLWICMCGNCNQMINVQFGYCTFCGMAF